MSHDLLPYAVLAALLLLGGYVCTLAIRSREAELRQALRKCEIALLDCERARQDAATFHASEVKRLKAELASRTSDEPRFRAAKSAFARLFHPDTLRDDAPERDIRADMFKQYWAELERIERQA